MSDSLLIAGDAIPSIQKPIDDSILLDLLTGPQEDPDDVLKRSPPFTLRDLPAFIGVINALGQGLDDRKHLLERLLAIISRLPEDSEFSRRLQNVLIDMLYNNLPHPPNTYLTLPKTIAVPYPRHLNYAFRSADGSNYNVLFPSFGQAGQPYARTVPSTHPILPSELPDPGVIFDTLLRRRSSSDQSSPPFQTHPGGLSSLFFAFANFVIHTLFQTNRENSLINDTSSYVDLSVLYGNSEEETSTIRRLDGTGRLWEDVWADKRIIGMPPALGVLVILFCRNHNYVAEQILQKNENGTYTSPSEIDETDRSRILAQCDEIYHRARLVNTAFFVQIVLRDYVGGILGLTRDGSEWRLNPLGWRPLGSGAPSGGQHQGRTPLGEGNVLSLEFNAMYRWHSNVSKQDEQWFEGILRDVSGREPGELTPLELMETMRTYVGERTKGSVLTWTIGNLRRLSTGRFSSSDLSAILHDATANPASAFGARNIPSLMKPIEVAGIEWIRSVGGCMLNEFRRYMKLRPYASFQEWNPDPEVYVSSLIQIVRWQFYRMNPSPWV